MYSADSVGRSSGTSSSGSSSSLGSRSDNSDVTTTESLASEPTQSEALSGVGPQDAAQRSSQQDRQDDGELTSTESLAREPTTTEQLASGSNDNESDPTNSAIIGVSAAVGREQVVQGMLARSYEAGLSAPQRNYSGDVHRGVTERYESSPLSYEFQNEGRYNAQGQHVVYGSPTLDAARQELSIYPDPDGNNRTFTRFDANIAPDPVTSRGGIADIEAGLRQQNLPASALTQPSTPGASQLLHTLTGESRYSAPQQVGKGATDAGAAAMRAPSAFGGSQINILPANADASVITPLSRQTITPSGAVGSQRSVAGVEPLSDFHKPVTSGALDMPAGAGNRISSVRYGALGAVGDTFAQAGVSAWNGESVDGGQLGQDVAINTTVGSVAAKVTDALTPRLGGLRAGGAVGGVIQASVSGYSNYQQYSAGEINGERAVANTVVDTGTAIAAGAAGAGVGALVGSVVPVAGTAVGAVVGFGVGIGAHYAIQAVDSVTGFTDAAKDSLTSGLESATGWVKS